MASRKEYLDFVLDQLKGMEDITYRPMMGEYILYYRSKVVGGIYDDRFLLKPTKKVQSLLPEARFELPYAGAKEMLLVEALDDGALLRKIVAATYDELSAPRKK